MVSLSGHSVYHLDVLTVWFCLLAVSQAAYVNVALNKPTYIQNQAYPGDDMTDASNAVDGRKSDLSYSGGQCAVSYGGQTATWWVNLTSIHSIHHITIYFLTENDLQAFAQNRKTVKGCIAGNVTMVFKPQLVKGKEVKTYIWNKFMGLKVDPSFAKFEPNISKFEIYYNEYHQVQNRLIHYPEEPATLYLTDLRKSDQQQYTLVISYVNYVGTPTEWIIDLQVQDVCFEKPKEVGKCAVTTCYTGDNGVLKMPGGKEQAVKGYKLVKVCDEMTTGNYSCCNAAGTCLVQLLQESMEFYGWLSYYYLGFSVYVSNTTDRLQGTLCYKDDNFTVFTIPAVFTTTCPVHGQYVIYYNERRPGVTYPSGYSTDVRSCLCEVEVYGCPGGFYGTNCSIACPDINCYCHIENGTCQICKPGYQGYLCKLACDKGWYGLGCSESCGQCRDVDKCLNTNGTCMVGCSAGYTGHRCHIPCPYGFFGPDCADRCNDTCDGCNNINGSCDYGCNPGWQGLGCQDACDQGSFGDNCSETCGHCRDIDQCSIINGTCLTGCDAGLQGDLCKYTNVALNKPAYQQYPYSPGDDTYDARNAVDGRKSDLSEHGGQCAVSYNRRTATWWVNLTSIHSIHHITIYFMTSNQPWGTSSYPKYLLGFSVYVSNTTDRLQGTLCYKDDNFTLYTIPAVFTTTCPVHGQYVIYYNERLPGVTYPRGYSTFVVSHLCEVEVYGCPGGFYGTNCSIACSDTNCYCHIETGTCQVCKPGYQGYLCKLACDKGSYGLGCSESCGQCRDVNRCLNTNGTCMTGCSAGYIGHRCHTRCPKLFWGDDCVKKCPDKCNGCNNINGLCESGCVPGWNGYNCNEECGRGSYGIDCRQTCGNCRDVYQCFHTNGTCFTGCIAGFQGDVCKTPCQRGFFGVNCALRCVETCDDCNDVTGLCDQGCLPGFKGYFCQTVCPYGLFGQDCTGECNDTCTGCNNVNGVCDRGCHPGWKGDYCDIACDKGLYGADCSETCGRCLNESHCFHTNGSCLTGCDAGYEGDVCKTPCPYGLFGQDCTGECNNNCTGCNIVSGVCDRGCHPGWRGDYCDIGR